MSDGERSRRARRKGAMDDAGAIDSVGLCARCAHATVQHSAKGSEFWRCRAADDDPSLLRYPPLPVRVCHAFAAGEPESRGSDAT